MPVRTPTPCRHPRCPHLAPCPEHSSRDRDLDSRAWRRLSAWHLARHPLCEDCLVDGRVAAATDPHHVDRRDEGGALLTDRLISLCKVHHAKRTAAGE